MYRIIVASCLLTVALGAAIPKADKKSLRQKPLFLSGRIVGGDDADISLVPWQVALELLTDFQYCAGFIVSENYIVSAAHCIEGFYPLQIQVRTGSSKRSSGGTVVKVKNFLRHPKRVPAYYDYDISVIELAEPIQFDNNSQPIRLADREPQGGDQVRISGWGDTVEGAGEGWPQLQTILVPVVDRTVCEEAYQDLVAVTDTMICAGTSQKASCQGDSGGAVVLNGTAVGIVSWALGCAEEGYPGVYTNIANTEILEFVHENTDI